MSSIALNAPVNVTPFPFTSFDTDASANLQAAGGENANMQNVDKVSKDFEAVFLSQMMGSMFAGDEITDYFGGGTAGEIYKSFLMNEYGKAIANSGGIGIAAQVKKELLKLQEAA